MFAVHPLTRRGLCRVEAAEWIGVPPSKFDLLVADARMPRLTVVDASDVRAVLGRLRASFRRGRAYGWNSPSIRSGYAIGKWLRGSNL